MEQSTADVPKERFCPQCGKSTVPLPVPHLSTDCKDCGRTVHFIRRGDDGQGIKAEAGERFTIPGDFLRISLVPTGHSKLFRPGIPFLLNRLFLSDLSPPEDFESFLATNERRWDQYLTSTEAGRGLDMTKHEDVALLKERLGKDKESHAWYVLMGSMAANTLLQLSMTPETREAAWTAYMLGTFRGLTIVSDTVFEETLWRGYLANEVVYEAAAAAGNRSPAELEALKKLQPLFAQFDEGTLSALVDSGVPIGPKIGVKHLPEELLRSLAKHQLSTWERSRQAEKEAAEVKRDEARHARQERRQDLELRIKWGGLGAAVATVVVTAVALVLNALPKAQTGPSLALPGHLASAPTATPPAAKPSTPAP